MKRNGLIESASLRRFTSTPEWATTLGERLTKTPDNSYFVFSLAGPFFFFFWPVVETVFYLMTVLACEKAPCVGLKLDLRSQGYAW